MATTVYETKTDGWDDIGLLTTLEMQTTVQTETLVQATSQTSDASDSSDEPLTAFTSSNATTSATHTSNLVTTSTPTLPSTSAPTLNTTQLSTASIVGIALGSVAVATLILVCLCFFLGFRIRLAKLPRHRTPNEAPGMRDERPVTLGGPYAKAELADSEYLRKVERLHEGSKPELDGSTALKSVWRLFSIRSLRTRGLHECPAELAAEPFESGPHELPGEGMLQSSREEPRDSRDST